MLEQILRDVLVHGELPGVDDTHVEAGPNRVIEERRMNGFAHDVVSAECKRQVADAAAHLRAGTGRLDDPRRLDEIDCVSVVLFETCRDRQNVRIEDDVGGIEPGALDQQAIRALANRDFPLDGVGLPLLVERHDDDAGAVTAHQRRLPEEILLALFQADRIDDGLSLNALQPRRDHRPFRAVDHDRHAGDLGLGRDVVEEVRHRSFRIEHPFVHVHIEQVRAAADLFERDRGRRRVVAGANHPGEAKGSGDVRALADHLKVRIGADRQRFEAGELGEMLHQRGTLHQCGTLHHGGHGGRGGKTLYVLTSVSSVSPVVERYRARRQPFDRLRNRGDVLRRRAAAAADDVHEAARGELRQVRGGLVRLLVVQTERVRQPGVRMAADEAVGELRELGEIRPHVARAERAVDADTERPCMAHRDPERVNRLPGQRTAAAIGDRHGDHQRETFVVRGSPFGVRRFVVRRSAFGVHGAALRVNFLEGNNRRFRIQGVEDCLEHQQVATAVDEAADLLLERVLHLVEGRGAKCRVVDIGRDRERAVHRADRPGGEPRLVRRPGRPFVRDASRQLRGRDVQFVGDRLEPVVGLHDRGAVERVRLDDIGAGLEILAVDRCDRVRAGQNQQIVVAPHVARVRRETVAAEVGLRQPQLLDHRAHRAVENQDAFPKEPVQHRLIRHLLTFEGQKP